MDQSGVPTQHYEAFMFKGSGPATMGAQIRHVYSPLFQASHKPHEEGQDDLKRLFHVHSGGSDDTINRQIQTFKALCEFASFDAPVATTHVSTNGQATVAITAAPTLLSSASAGLPTIHVDLHIHLPENKTTRDYEAIIQDIARYIYRIEVNSNGQ